MPVRIIFSNDKKSYRFTGTEGVEGGDSLQNTTFFLACPGCKTCRDFYYLYRCSCGFEGCFFDNEGVTDGCFLDSCPKCGSKERPEELGRLCDPFSPLIEKVTEGHKYILAFLATATLAGVFVKIFGDIFTSVVSSGEDSSEAKRISERGRSEEERERQEEKQSLRELGYDVRSFKEQWEDEQARKARKAREREYYDD